MPERSRVGRPRRLLAEALGTGALLCTVVGSGIMGDTLAAGNVAIALLAHAVATAAILTVLIWTFAPISGAHFNPAVTLAVTSQRGLSWREMPGYVLAQVVGAVGGVLVAHAMFAQPLLQWSQRARAGTPQLVSEGVATFGLLSVIWGCGYARKDSVGAAVGLYILAAYWFTASTSFANPAVTIARSITDTFAGIRPGDAPGFVLAQLSGAVAATLIFKWLLGPRFNVDEHVA